MSRSTPDGNAPCAANGTPTRGGNSLATAAASIGITGDAQHPHVQRTQNAGQPLSVPDSLVPTAQFSGTTSELTPLASAISRANSAVKSARRIQSMVYHAIRPRVLEPTRLLN